MQGSKISTVEAKQEPEQEGEEESATQIDYMFHVGSNAVIDCLIGNTKVKMVIDSGAAVNMITLETWRQLKANKVKVTNEELGSQKNYFAYGQEQPIEIVGNFETTMRIGETTVEAKIFVVKHAKHNLLSKDTSEDLGVLKVGLINNTNHELQPFPKVI